MVKFNCHGLQTALFAGVFMVSICQNRVNCIRNESMIIDRTGKAIFLCTGTNNTSCNVTGIDTLNNKISGCYLNGTSMHCPSVIPTTIPDYVMSVYLIKIHPYIWNKTCLFCDKSWTGVTFLSIFEDAVNLTLSNYTFVGLHSLRHLWIKCRWYFFFRRSFFLWDT